MRERIEFEFNDKLTHQLDAIKATTALFKGLPTLQNDFYKSGRLLATKDSSNPSINILGTRVLNNLNQIQLDNNIFPDKDMFNSDFAIEMETGTGKTYVYLRTILELNQKYGFKKFMIVVPSVAIKSGTKKSVEMLQKHFNTLYNIDILKHCFTFDANKVKDVNNVFDHFIDSNELSICIINTQSFNSKKTRIRKGKEDGIELWEEIKNVSPIVILDEPQRIEGKNKKKRSKEGKMVYDSATKQALVELNPLFTLKYSATHKDEFKAHFIYRLDSCQAFKRNLVKAIKVKTIFGTVTKNYPFVRYISFTKDLKAKIEIFYQEQGKKIKFKTFDVVKGVSLEELSNNLPQYKGWRIAAEPNKNEPLKIDTPKGHISIELTANNADINQTEVARIQIRLAIRNHLDKQFAILEKGEQIKALSLFFVDKVSKIRDDSQPDGRGEYLRLFDEEYSKIIPEYKEKFEKYNSLFPEYNDLVKIRQGYFAIDKKTNKAIECDESYEKTTEPQKKLIDEQIDLILNGKDKLISFDTPLAFIFSHSALREGWDNPNIFTLCTLKHANSEIAKKQEIGRGLRLPVDINGKRILDEEINQLTVIANDHYENFAKNLQKDFNDNEGFNREQVSFDLLTETLKNAGVPKEKITNELVVALKKELEDCAIIDKNQILINEGANLELIDFCDNTLQEHSIKIKEAFIKLMTEQGSSNIKIINGDEEEIVNEQFSYVKEEDFKKILDNLKKYMIKRSIYKFNINNEDFIGKCVEKVNQYLENANCLAVIEITDASVNVNQNKISVKQDVPTREQRIENTEILNKLSDMEIINTIMYHTMLPRMVIIQILQKVNDLEKLRSQDILDEVKEIINGILMDEKSKLVYAYEIIDGYELDWAKIIEADFVDNESLENAQRVFKSNFARRKAINKYYKMDSAGETKFAEALEADPNVVLFTKLKKGGFVIDTPYGDYSPDWVVIVKEEASNTHKMYFIIESKFEKEGRNLTPVEERKKHCGTLHFKAVDTNNLKFDWVNSYNDFKQKFGIIEVI